MEDDYLIKFYKTKCFYKILVIVGILILAFVIFFGGVGWSVSSG